MKRVVPVGILVSSVAVLCGCSSASDPHACDLPNVPAGYCDDAHQMLLADSLPVARGNQFADNVDAARFGFSLFFDSNLGSGTSCATCHSPELAFVDRLAVSKGKGTGTRNAPTTFNAAYYQEFFWDGRADSLWSQPLFPIENPLEMATTRLAVAQFIAARYEAEYEAVFGALPDMSSWPTSGKPGDPAFDVLPSDTQDQVNRLFSNVGKAFEAYMRNNATTAAPLDAFLKGDSSQLIEAAQRGLAVFLENKCQSCHSGSLFSDQGFHDVGFPSLPGASPDLGRAGGLPVLQQNPFNLEGPFADPEPDGTQVALPSAGPDDTGAFRTPSLRNVTLTFPYGHDGALASLGDVLAVHAPTLMVTERNDLLAFLQTLNGSYPVPPWNNWPTPQ